MGIRSFEKSGHISKPTARATYGLIWATPLASLVWILALHPKSAVLWVLTVTVAVSAVRGWFVYDGAYALDDSGSMIDHRPRTLSSYEQAMKDYERDPSAETADRLRKELKERQLWHS